MEQGYKKHILDLEVLYSGYKLWKDEAIYAYSRIETYKEKGTIYFTVRNLLPSTVLGFSYNREYRMVFIGIPGRFILEEQPDQGSSGFKLWQPLKGAEKLYTYIEDLSDEEKHDIFGYWIAGIDKINGDFFPV